MDKKQMNILVADITKQQLRDLAEWWGLWWKSRPHNSAIVRQCVDRVWTEENARRRSMKVERDMVDEREG